MATQSTEPLKIVGIDTLEITSVKPQRGNRLRIGLEGNTFAKTNFVANFAAGEVTHLSTGDKLLWIANVSFNSHRVLHVTVVGKKGESVEIARAYAAGELDDMKPSRVQ